MEKSDAIAALAALAQDSRLDIFRLLVEAGSEGRAAGHVGERLGLPSATLSFHLNQLRQAGLVAYRREGRSLIYAANLAATRDLIGYLTENCCGGEPADCGVGVGIGVCAPSGPAAIEASGASAATADDDRGTPTAAATNSKAAANLKEDAAT